MFHPSGIGRTKGTPCKTQHKKEATAPKSIILPYPINSLTTVSMYGMCGINP